MSDVEERTRRWVDEIYEAYLSGNALGMLEPLADDVEVRFLGRGAYQGIDEVREFLTMNTAKMKDLDFRIRKVIVDGNVAAVVWDEDAMTHDDRPYANHGIDVFEAKDEGVFIMHVNNDVVEHRNTFGRL